jgi:DinB family protein
VYWDYAFGSASLTFDLDLPGDVAEATDWLFASHQPVLDAVDGLTDADIDREVPTSWGELWPLHRVVATLVNEQVHHGAEISLLRDLYRNRTSLRSGVPVRDSL